MNDSKPEYAIPEHPEINLLATKHWQFLNVSRLNTRFLNISKSTSFLDSTAYIWTFAPWKRDSWASANRILSCRHCPYLKFTSLNTRFLCICFSNHLQDGTARILRFTAWKSHSWESANSPACRMTLPIYERFAVWKDDSWEIANRSLCRTAKPIFESFAGSNTISEHQKIEIISCRHCFYLNVFSLNKRFIRISKLTHLHGGSAHIWTYRSWNLNPWASGYRPHAGRRCPSLRSLKTRTWVPANRPACRTALPLSTGFATWKHD